MARGVTLGRLLDKLRVELKSSLNPAHNRDSRDRHVSTLQDTQEWLWDDFAWPHLNTRKIYRLEAGQHLYDVRDDFDVSRIEKIEGRVDGRWIKLTPGINASQYAEHDTDLGERSSPARNWQLVDDEQIEIWPLPDTNGDVTTFDDHIRVHGIRRLRKFVEDDDRADLDDQLIVLFAAGSILGETPAGKIKLNTAQRRYRRLRGNLTPSKSRSLYGIGEPQGPRRLFIGTYKPPGS